MRASSSRCSQMVSTTAVNFACSAAVGRVREAAGVLEAELLEDAMTTSCRGVRAAGSAEDFPVC